MKKIAGLAILAALLGWTITRHTTLYTMPLYDGDGHIHYKQLVEMWEGLKTANPFKLFCFNLNYGTPYFFSALFLAIPGLVVNNSSLFLMGPRLVAALSALGTVILLYKILKHHTPHRFAVVFSGLLCLMPAFWTMTRIFRPDWTLAVAITAFLYFLLRDKGHFGTCFWKGVGCFGLALAIKTQAMMFLPVLLAYGFQQALFYPRIFFKEHLVLSIKRLSKALLMVAGIFIVINPHALHPVGFYGICRRFQLELLQMTPDSPTGTLSFFQRLTIVSENLLSMPVLLAAFCAGVWTLYYCLKKKKNSELCAVILGSIPCFVFLLLLSHKCNWNFLISAIPFLPLYAVMAFNKASHKLQILILTLCVLSGLYTLAPQAKSIFLPDYSQLATQVQSDTDFVIPLLAPYQARLHYIGVSNDVVVDYEKLGLQFRQVRVILGLLEPWQVNPYAHETHWKDLRHIQKKLGLSHISIKPYYPRQALIISKRHPWKKTEDLQALLNNHYEYVLVGQNEHLYVFIHKKTL